MSPVSGDAMRLCCLLGILIGFTAFWSGAAQATVVWRKYVVANNTCTVSWCGDVLRTGLYPSIGLNQAREPYIVFHDETRKHFGWKEYIAATDSWSPSWVWLDAGATGNEYYANGAYASVVSRPNGTHNAAWNDSRGIRYDPLGDWNGVQVTDFGPSCMAFASSLAFDPVGEPRVGFALYCSGNQFAVPSLVQHTGAGWQIASPNPANRGTAPTLQVNAQGQSQLCFVTFDETLQNSWLILATYLGGVWNCDTIAPAAIDPPAFRIDASGVPWIAYLGFETVGGSQVTRLKVARRVNGVWLFEGVDPPSSGACRPTMLIDPYGQPHVTFCTVTPLNASDVAVTVKYAHRLTVVGWQVETVDNQTTPMGGYETRPSLVLDWQTNKPHVAYTFTDAGPLLSSGNSWLMYARRDVEEEGGGGGGYEIDPAVDLRTPNPVVSGGALSFALRLPRGGGLRLDLLDIAGRRIAARAETQYGPGQHQVIWPLGNIEAGVYFVRVSVEGQILANGRVVVVR